MVVPLASRSVSVSYFTYRNRIDGDLAGSLPEGTQLQQLLLGRGQAAAELAWGGCGWCVVRHFGGLVLK